MKKTITSSLVLVVNFLFAQEIEIPKSHSNIEADENGIYLNDSGQQYYASMGEADYSLEQLFGDPKGTDGGVMLDFGDFEGFITYGLIPYGKAPHPLPVFRFVKTLESGKVDINIKRDFR
ncbi:MAG: hypothetical protein AAFY00_02825 [Bacteroidota bacterium]